MLGECQKTDFKKDVAQKLLLLCHILLSQTIEKACLLNGSGPKLNTVFTFFVGFCFIVFYLRLVSTQHTTMWWEYLLHFHHPLYLLLTFSH